MTDNWPEIVGDIMQNYVSTIEMMYDRNYPPIGIIKTGRSSAALDSLQTKIEDNDVNIETPLPWGATIYYSRTPCTTLTTATVIRAPSSATRRGSSNRRRSAR